MSRSAKLPMRTTRIQRRSTPLRQLFGLSPAHKPMKEFGHRLRVRPWLHPRRLCVRVSPWKDLDVDFASAHGPTCVDFASVSAPWRLLPVGFILFILILSRLLTMACRDWLPHFILRSAGGIHFHSVCSIFILDRVPGLIDWVVFIFILCGAVHCHSACKFHFDFKPGLTRGLTDAVALDFILPGRTARQFIFKHAFTLIFMGRFILSLVRFIFQFIDTFADYSFYFMFVGWD
ncbi:hypothetical protein FB451DRAFT_1188716 [Mycena latifolia]|nr:hypothetical protein FB451DRAFT_1188716 [Mycena latifolia]